MRNFPRLLRCLAVGGVVTLPLALAAQESQQLQPPAGPLIRTAPDYTQWVVSYTYPPPSSAPPPPPSPTDQYRTKTVTTTKTGSYIHEQMITAAGQTTDCWFLGSTEYFHDAGANVWSEMHPGSGGGGMSYAGLPANGFRGLDWIAAANYLGIIEHAGHKCLVFVPGGRTANLTADQLDELGGYALIDFTTRLPLEVKELGSLRSYRFTNLPSEKQALPPDLLKVLKQGQDMRARISQQPPRPY